MHADAILHTLKAMRIIDLHQVLTMASALMWARSPGIEG
jgi:hypothetical protein